MSVLVAQSCPTLCDPMNSSQPGSSIHEILQARILEWVSISFSRRFADPETEPESPTFQVGRFLPPELPGKPKRAECRYRYTYRYRYRYIDRYINCIVGHVTNRNVVYFTIIAYKRSGNKAEL